MLHLVRPVCDWLCLLFPFPLDFDGLLFWLIRKLGKQANAFASIARAHVFSLFRQVCPSQDICNQEVKSLGRL